MVELDNFGTSGSIRAKSDLYFAERLGVSRQLREWLVAEWFCQSFDKVFNGAEMFHGGRCYDTVASSKSFFLSIFSSFIHFLWIIQAKSPYKNNLYIFAILPNAFGFAGSLHTWRYASLRQFPKSLRDISRNLSSLFLYSSFVLNIIFSAFISAFNVNLHFPAPDRLMNGW